MNGRLIAVEGADGSGKSTQAELLAKRLRAVYTREPGGTALGEQLRNMVLDLGGKHPVDRAEALMIAAARAQHVDEVVRPALIQGRDVVTDRYIESSIAYQGYGRQLGATEITEISLFATEGLVADLIIFIDVDSSVAAKRRIADPDRIESAGDDFHERVVSAYRSMATAEPERWVVIDGNGTVEEVAKRVTDSIDRYLDRS